MLRIRVKEGGKVQTLLNDMGAVSVDETAGGAFFGVSGVFVVTVGAVGAVSGVFAV